MAIAVDKLRAVLPRGYVVDSFLDSGGQGSVYRGSVSGIEAAIKLFESDIDPRRLQRELDALQNINCPHLVKILAHCQIDIDHRTIGVIAYEYHSGGSLLNILRGPPPSADVILEIGAQVGTAIERLWERRIVHRDIKPANIVKAADGRYVLVDIGFARHIDLTAISGIGQAPGTPGYKSPEQAAGRRNLTIRSDIFSLGITLYEIASLHHPFMRMQHMIGRMAPRSLLDHRPDISLAACGLIHRMMSIPPIHRPIDSPQRFLALLGR